MQRAIVGFQRDGEGEWVAELACGHRQHVRHQPPFFPRPWVLDSEGREERFGTPLDCRICEQGVPAPMASRESGGEGACYAHLVCPDCGALVDGGPHRPDCPLKTLSEPKSDDRGA